MTLYDAVEPAIAKAMASESANLGRCSAVSVAGASVGYCSIGPRRRARYCADDTTGRRTRSTANAAEKSIRMKRLTLRNTRM